MATAACTTTGCGPKVESPKRKPPVAEAAKTERLILEDISQPEQNPKEETIQKADLPEADKDWLRTQIKFVEREAELESQNPIYKDKEKGIQFPFFFFVVEPHIKQLQKINEEMKALVELNIIQEDQIEDLKKSLGLRRPVQQNPVRSQGEEILYEINPDSSKALAKLVSLSKTAPDEARAEVAKLLN